MKYKQIPLQDYTSHLKNNPSCEELEIFKKSILELNKIDEKESEEHQKNEINKFLESIFDYRINTKDRIDAVIYEDNHAKVIIETKALKNKNDFPSLDSSGHNLNCKAFHETILYYLRESKQNNNNNIKYIIICNLIEYFIIDAKEYEKYFASDKEIIHFFKNTKEGANSTTDKFYKDIKDYLTTKDYEISYAYFNLESNLETNLEDNLALIYKALSPESLLKQNIIFDANILNENFYNELLYILGLKEITQNGKILIKANNETNSFSDSIAKAFDLHIINDFEIIFSLITTWNNRILFLRLLESMLISFEHFKKAFLRTENIKSFVELNTLFFEILAIKEDKRENIPTTLSNIPYLNSSLFDKINLERDGKEIKLLDSKPLVLYKNSILKKDNNFKDKQSLNLLEYLFAFLNTYDFTTTPKDLENHKKINFDKLINSSILGLVFEKLNGYKDGSFYTPSFITNYMCEEAIEQTIIDKFNSKKQWHCKSLDDLHNKIDDIKEANEIFNSIRICDPAVGSGHFLVSVLNQLILIKFKLGILCDEDYRRIKDIKLEIINDEIVIKDPQGKLFNYTLPTHEEVENHKIQKALFFQKNTLIQSCIFGVDINNNSCEITKLRLWIELLKYSFYYDIENKYLETLPNIDINIKCGNSIISNIDLKMTKEYIVKDLKDKLDKFRNLENMDDLQSSIQDLDNKFNDNIEKYKKAVFNYKNETNKDLKKSHKKQIEESKIFIINLFKKLSSSFHIDFKIKLKKYLENYGWDGIDEAKIKEENLSDKLKKVLQDYAISFNFHKTNIPKSNIDIVQKDLIDLIQALHNYENFLNAATFEWRFEFPEVLNDEGDFLGFDIVIGNPPYIRHKEIKNLKPHLEKHFKIYSGTSDIFTYFFEQAYKLLKKMRILSLSLQINGRAQDMEKN